MGGVLAWIPVVNKALLPRSKFLGAVFFRLVFRCQPFLGIGLLEAREDVIQNPSQKLYLQRRREVVQVVCIEGKQEAFGARFHVGDSRFAHEADFAENLSGAEGGDDFPVIDNTDLTLNENEHVEIPIALLDNSFVRQDPGPLADLKQDVHVITAEFLEERDAFQDIHECRKGHVSHLRFT